jgi:hypothetical protein
MTTQSDRSGRFLLTHVPEGRQTLLIDGRSASSPGRRFGVFQARVETRTGETTVLPFTTWMPRLDQGHAVAIPSRLTEDVIVTTPRIPGLELHLPKGSVIRDHQGNIAREISITPIPVDQPPFPLPTGVEVPVYFTIQPGGGYLDSYAPWPAGARLVYPNYHGERPGTRINFCRMARACTTSASPRGPASPMPSSNTRRRRRASTNRAWSGTAPAGT